MSVLEDHGYQDSPRKRGSVESYLGRNSSKPLSDLYNVIEIPDKPPSVTGSKHSQRSYGRDLSDKPPSSRGSKHSHKGYKTESYSNPPSVSESRHSQISYKTDATDKLPSVTGSRNSQISYKNEGAGKPPSAAGSKCSRFSYKRYHSVDKPTSIAESKCSRISLNDDTILEDDQTQQNRLGRFQRLSSERYDNLPTGSIRAPGWYVKGGEMSYIMLVSRQEDLLERLARPNSNACLINNCIGTTFRSIYNGEDVICLKVTHMDNSVDMIERAVRAFQMNGLPEVAHYAIFTHRNLMANGSDGKMYEKLAKSRTVSQISRKSDESRESSKKKSHSRSHSEDNKSVSSSKRSKVGSTAGKKESEPSSGITEVPTKKSSTDSTKLPGGSSPSRTESREFGSNKSTVGSKLERSSGKSSKGSKGDSISKKSEKSEFSGLSAESGISENSAKSMRSRRSQKSLKSIQPIHNRPSYSRKSIKQN